MELKIAFLIILVSVSNVLAIPTYSQVAKVTLNMENRSLEQVMDEIERQTEFYFIFNQKQIDVNRIVDIQEENKLITDILPELFKGTNVNYAILDRKILLTTDPIENNLLAIASGTEPQQNRVTGTVTDKNGPIPGANVVVTGTTLGTITDIAGKYSIEVPQGSKSLTFSFIGMVSQEISIGTLTQINVTMAESAVDLEEVVVIGYGTAKKETLTGSITAIKSDAIQTTKTSSVAGKLQGRVVGLQIRQRTSEPGTYSNWISIRGFGAPLLVVDGVVRDGMTDFEKLNPEDIESISILKDASAAIYGMNADNGVIIVTTKKGTKGETKFSYSAMGIIKQPTTTDRKKSVDAYTYRWMKNEADRNTGNSQTYSPEEIEKWRLGTEPGYQDFNWYDICLKNYTTQQQHNLSMTGGSDNITYFSSFGYMDDDGWSKSTMQYFKKYNFRSTVDFKLAKGLTAKISVAGKYDDRKTNPGPEFLWTFKRIIVADRGIGIHTLANPNHFTVVPAENINPVALITEDVAGYRRNSNFQYQSTIDLNYEVPFVKGLSLGVLVAYDGNIEQEKNLSKGYPLYDYRTDAKGSTPRSTFQHRLTNFNRKVLISKISYRTTIGQVHNFSSTLVNEMRRTNSDYVQAKRQFDDIYTHDIINQGSLTNQSTAGSLQEEAFISYLGRFNYDYKNKYLVEFSFREDGSYRYAPSKRWAFFPAGSVGWRISEEAFIKNNVPIISNLKIRGSYGLMGADAGSAFQYYEGYKFSEVRGGFVFDDNILSLGMVPPGVINKNLTWINTKTADLGLDLEFWKGKLGVTADIFQKNRDGLLATRSTSVPNTFGASFPEENLNSDKVRGYELEVSHRNKIGDFNYGVSANLTYSRRYLLHVERSPYTTTWGIWKDGSAGNGRILGRQWMYEDEGTFTDITQYETYPLIGGNNGNSKCLPGMLKIKDVNGDGIINSNDQVIKTWTNGVNPPLQYGMSMNASWKSIDVNLLLQGASLFTINNGGNRDVQGYMGYPTCWAKFLDRWHTEDPNADPRDPATEWIQGYWEPLTTSNSGTQLSAQNNILNRWRFNGTYLRIKSIEVGYTIPMNITRKIGIDNLRVFLNTYNLFTFCRKDLKMYDPERDEGPWSVELTYPLMREFTFGINVNF